MRRITRGVASRTNLFLFCLWVLEGSALIVALAIYKKGAHPFATFLRSPAGLAAIAAVLALAASTAMIFWLARADRARIDEILVLNLASLVLAVSTAELMIRVLAIETPEGRMFAGTLLLPRPWEEIAARNRAVLERASSQGSFLVADDRLGWTIGADRSSRDYNRSFVRRVLTQQRAHCGGASPEEEPAQAEPERDPEIYFSSAEGLRSPRTGIAFARQPARRRIALVGDSFTFGLEVRYEETWGHQLERILGDGTQVLNFGVDGYGVDQAVLRYRKDVVAWHPDLVILGVIHDDFRRTLCVYGFLCFPGSQIPFAKPRFVLNDHTPELVNTPLPSPDAIFAKTSIAELPFVDLDPAYGQRGDWEEHFYHRLYSIRFLISRFPRYPEPSPALSVEAMEALNAEIVRSFLREARENGSDAMVAFFPSHVPICGPESSSASGSFVKHALDDAQIPFLDLTDCVDRVDPEERFAALHYSATTNAAVARCVADEIRRRPPR